MLNLFVHLKGYFGFFVFDLLFLFRFFVTAVYGAILPIQSNRQPIFCAATLGAVCLADLTHVSSD